MTKTPGIHRIINTGVYTPYATTVYPSLSAESWTSLLHGVPPTKHGIYTENPPRHSFPLDSPYPSIFRVLHEQDSEAVMASFCNWPIIAKNIIEDKIGVQKYTGYTEKSILKSFERFMSNYDPTLVFFQFDDTDTMGHRFGFFSMEQTQQLTKTDETVGKIIDIIEKYDPNNESLILILADHGGGGFHPRMHGSEQPQDMQIFWTARGKGICKNTLAESRIKIVDTAGFVASFLGLKIPKTWEGENIYKKLTCK